MADPIDLQAIADGTVTPPVPKGFTVPPAGYGRALYRGVAQGMAGIDQLGANMFSAGHIFPNAASDAAQREADRRRTELAAIDAADKLQAPTTGQQVASGATANIIGALPYMATKTLKGAAALGALENADLGPGEMAKGALYGAVGTKAGRYVNGAAGKLVNATPLLKSAPNFIRQGTAGALTGVTSGAVMSGGDPVDTMAQGVAGGMLGASQRNPAQKAALSNDELAAARLQAATGKTGARSTHPAWESFGIVMDPLRKSAANLGLDTNSMTVKDLLKVARNASAMHETEYQSYLDPIRKQKLYPTQVKDAIENSITSAERDGITEESGAIGEKLQARASEFGKEMTVQHLEDLRKMLFERRTGKSGEAVKERTQADLRADRIAEDAIKDVLYNLADQQAAKAPGYVRGTLKTQQHHLIELQDALIDRSKALEEQEGIRRGTPWYQRMNLTAAVHPSGKFVGSMHGVAKMLLGDPDSLAQANKRVQSAFQISPGKTPSPFFNGQDRVPAMIAGQLNDRNKKGEPDLTPEQQQFLQQMGHIIPTTAPPAGAR